MNMVSLVHNDNGGKTMAEIKFEIVEKDRNFINLT